MGDMLAALAGSILLPLKMKNIIYNCNSTLFGIFTRGMLLSPIPHPDCAAIFHPVRDSEQTDKLKFE